MSKYNKYVGLPWKKGGRDSDGFDCFGLVRHLLIIEAGIQMPRLDHVYYDEDFDKRKLIKTIAEYTANMPLWHPIDHNVEKREFDIVHLRSGGPIHFGMMINDKQFIHIERGCDSVIESTDSIHWKNKIRGFYRHESNA